MLRRDRGEWNCAVMITRLIMTDMAHGPPAKPIASPPPYQDREPRFHRDILFLLHDVARLLHVDADKRARAHGMTRAQWGILIWLERQPGISQKELAELLEVEPITVARLIDRLEGRGMVERRPDPKDRRIWRLHLLPPAHEVLREISHQRNDMTRTVSRGIPPETLDTMIEALLRMKSTMTQDAQSARRGAQPTDADTREVV